MWLERVVACSTGHVTPCDTLSNINQLTQSLPGGGLYDTFVKQLLFLIFVSSMGGGADNASRRGHAAHAESAATVSEGNISSGGASGSMMGSMSGCERA